VVKSSVTRFKPVLPYLLLACLVFGQVALFASRAVYLDEPIFLRLANSVESNWRFPSDIPGIFFGMPVDNFAAHTHPPAGEYFLFFIATLLGSFQEVPHRLVYAVFPIIAILSFYCIAKRLTLQPLLIAVILAASPSFVVIAPTLMMDVTQLAFLLLGVACYMQHLEGRKYKLALSSMAFVMAAGTGYTALIPIGCLFLVALLSRRPLKELLAVATAPIVLAVWLVFMTIHFHQFPLTMTVGVLASHRSMVHNVAAVASFIGGVALFPLSVAHVTKSLDRKWFVISAVLLATAFSLADYGVLHRVAYIVFAAAGLLLLMRFAAEGLKIVRDGCCIGEAVFLLWCPFVLAFFVLVAEMINARYILLALPALFLIVFRRTSAKRLALAIVPTIVVSLTVATGDVMFVGSYREFVRATIRPLQQHSRIWSGAESGLRFYLEQEGIESLSNVDSRPQARDLVIRPARLFRYRLAEPVEGGLSVLRTYELHSRFPVRTFNPDSGVGFHDSRVGLLPYTFSLEPFDRIEVAQMRSELTPPATSIQ